MEHEGLLPEYKGNLTIEFITKAKAALSEYKGQKNDIKARIQENNKWYAVQYAKMYNSEKNTTEPATAFILNAIENKYADAVDNYPYPNFLEREQKDKNAARVLTGVVPVILEQSKFKKVYKRNWRQKLKHGTAVYGVFYDESEGQLNITDVDILNVYCDTHIKDVQDSPFLFISSIVPNDELSKLYPEYKGLFMGNATVTLGNGTTAEIEGKTEIFDCYYKKYTDGRFVVHMFKMAGGHILEATEDIETVREYDDVGAEISVTEGYENGLYDHGKYPVVFDVLYPDDSCIFGFGIVDIVKNPQMYIDKLDGIIAKNAMLAGKKRYMIKDNGGINEEEFRDAGNDIIHCAGGVGDDNVREMQVSALDSFVITHRQNKINEMKEVVGNRDFQQGGTSGGVTAASAIATLQQAGEKISRTMIDDSYDVYKEIIEMTIELIRQFMTEEQTFRITGEDGGISYESFSGNSLYDSVGLDMTERKPIYFDIDIVPQKQNPFSREANNQTIIALWNAGFFNPQLIDMALVALPSMSFDGKEKIIQSLQQYKSEQQMMADMVQVPMQQAPIVEDLGNGYSAVNINGAMPKTEDMGNGYTAVQIEGAI